jgi:DNA repair protein RadC
MSRIPIYRLKLVLDRQFSRPFANAHDPKPVLALFFHRLIGMADREHVAAIFFDLYGSPIGSTIAGMGTLDSVSATPREVLKAALVSNASSLILSHNHPSNSPEPSLPDRLATRRLRRAGEMLGISVLDHIIVTPSGAFTSFQERGLMSTIAHQSAQGTERNELELSSIRSPLTPISED